METGHSLFGIKLELQIWTKMGVGWQGRTRIDSQLPGVIWAGCNLFQTNFKNLDEISCCAKSKVTVLSRVPSQNKRLP